MPLENRERKDESPIFIRLFDSKMMVKVGFSSFEFSSSSGAAKGTLAVSNHRMAVSQKPSLVGCDQVPGIQDKGLLAVVPIGDRSQGRRLHGFEAKNDAQAVDITRMTARTHMRHLWCVETSSRRWVELREG